MKFFVLGILICISSTMLVNAQIQTRSLDYFIGKAEENSPVLREQENLASDAELQSDLAKAELLHPQVYGTADYLYAPTFGRYGYDPAVTNGGAYSALLNIQYPLITSKKLQTRNNAAKTVGEESVYQIQFAKHQLIRTITDQYINAYQSAEQIEYLNEVLELMQNHLEVMKKLAKQGLVKITDLRQFEIEIQRLNVDKRVALSSFRDNLVQLNTVSGILDSSLVELSKPELMLAPKEGGSNFLQRFQFDSLRLSIDQQLSELKYQPSLSVFGDAGLNTTLFSGLDNNYGFSAGLHLSIPIYDGNQKKITRKQTSLKQNSLEGYQQRFEQERENNLDRFRLQLEDVKQQHSMLTEQIKSYETLLEKYRKELSNGELSIIDYLTFLRNYTDARNQLVQLESRRLSLINAYNYWNW